VSGLVSLLIPTGWLFVKVDVLDVVNAVRSPISNFVCQAIRPAAIFVRSFHITICVHPKRTCEGLVTKESVISKCALPALPRPLPSVPEAGGIPHDLDFSRAGLCWLFGDLPQTYVHVVGWLNV
jgi:hypothetical protein